MVCNVNLATESKQKNKQTMSLKSANIHVILGQGVSNSNMKGQTQAMYLIQCPPPLFGRGYSHNSLLPRGAPLYFIFKSVFYPSHCLWKLSVHNTETSLFNSRHASSSAALAQSTMPSEKNVFDSYYLQQLLQAALN